MNHFTSLYFYFGEDILRGHISIKGKENTRGEWGKLRLLCKYKTFLWKIFPFLGLWRGIRRSFLILGAPPITSPKGRWGEVQCFLPPPSQKSLPAHGILKTERGAEGKINGQILLFLSLF
jgi:hypothetical protein